MYDKRPALALLLAMTAAGTAHGQQVLVSGVVNMPYSDPAYLNVAEGRLTTVPTGPFNLTCPGVTTNPPSGPYAQLGNFYVPLEGNSTSSSGRIVIDGVSYEAGNDPIEIFANGVTVIPAPGFTSCRRSNGQQPPGSTAVVFYGPNSQTTFLNPAVKPRLDTTSVPYTLILETTTGDVICDPVPVAGPTIFANSFE